MEKTEVNNDISSKNLSTPTSDSVPFSMIHFIFLFGSMAIVMTLTMYIIKHEGTENLVVTGLGTLGLVLFMAIMIPKILKKV